MYNSNYEKNNKIRDLIFIIKIIALFCCAILAFTSIFNINKIPYEKDSFLNIKFMTTLLIILFSLFFIWGLITILSKFRYNKNVTVLQYFVFIFVFSLLIIKSNSYSSDYKYIFIFIIITSTIELGLTYGIMVSVTSSLIILAIDLVYTPFNGINIYFQNDLILVSTFNVIALILGCYVKTDEEYLTKKNQQLTELNKELEAKNLKQKYIEDVLLKNEACYNVLIENSGNAIIVHRNNKLIFLSESASKFLGIDDSTQLHDRSLLEFIPEDDVSFVTNKFNEMYDKRKIYSTFEEKIVDFKGNMSFVNNTSTYFIYDGQPTILSIIHDISSEKQVEALKNSVDESLELLKETREHNEFMTEFFSNISHELKTPLNVIFSAIQVLNIYKDFNNNEDFLTNHDKYLKIMKQNCYRLMRLINNLLDMTRLDSGFLKLNLQNLNIVSVVEDITLSVAPYVESKGLSLIFDTEDEEIIMSIDPDKIERIMLNLLSNALKFTESGGHIFVNIISKDDYIIISVKDTGTGIPADKLNLIFDRFWQADKTLKRNHEGTGIGLSLVKSFVEMHLGSIKVKSSLGEGSEFIISLPVKIQEDTIQNENLMFETNIEKINLEFSDIYS